MPTRDPLYTLIVDIEAFNLPRRLIESQGNIQAIKDVIDTITHKLVVLDELLEKGMPQ